MGWIEGLRQLWSSTFAFWDSFPEETEMKKKRRPLRTRLMCTQHEEYQFVLLNSWAKSDGLGPCDPLASVLDNMRLLVEGKDFRLVTMLLLASVDPKQCWGKLEVELFEHLKGSSDPALFHVLIDNHKWEVGLPYEDGEGYTLRIFPEINHEVGIHFPQEWIVFTGPAHKQVSDILHK